MSIPHYGDNSKMGWLKRRPTRAKHYLRIVLLAVPLLILQRLKANRLDPWPVNHIVLCAGIGIYSTLEPCVVDVTLVDAALWRHVRPLSSKTHPVSTGTPMLSVTLKELATSHVLVLTALLLGVTIALALRILQYLKGISGRAAPLGMAQ